AAAGTDQPGRDPRTLRVLPRFRGISRPDRRPGLIQWTALRRSRPTSPVLAGISDPWFLLHLGPGHRADQQKRREKPAAFTTCRQSPEVVTQEWTEQGSPRRLLPNFAEKSPPAYQRRYEQIR